MAAGAARAAFAESADRLGIGSTGQQQLLLQLQKMQLQVPTLWRPPTAAPVPAPAPAAAGNEWPPSMRK